MSAKTEITQNALLQRDHSDMTSHLLYLEIDIIHFGRDSSKHLMTIIHLKFPQDGMIRMTWVLKAFIMFKWTSVSTCGWAFLLYFCKCTFSFCKDKLVCLVFVTDIAAFCVPTALVMFCSADQTVTFWQLGWSSNTEIVKYPHSAIGHRLSATKAYENNVPSLDWHGL